MQDAEKAVSPQVREIDRKVNEELVPRTLALNEPFQDLRSEIGALTYQIEITNMGPQTVQLRSRVWSITDARGHTEEVRGPGVVGEQPTLRPGEHFEYTSGCVLETPRGQMHGTYQMVRADGSEFDATIAPFALVLPYSLN